MAGLDDAELAEPEEIERMVLTEEWGPVLSLPGGPGRQGAGQLAHTQTGVTFGPFGVVEFDRHESGPETSKPKVRVLRDRLKDVMILFGIVRERLPRQASVVLKLVRMGVIDVDHIAHSDMRSLVKLYRRARDLRERIEGMERAGRGRPLSRAMVSGRSR